MIGIIVTDAIIHQGLKEVDVSNNVSPDGLRQCQNRHRIVSYKRLRHWEKLQFEREKKLTG